MDEVTGAAPPDLDPPPSAPLDEIEWRIDSPIFEGDTGPRCRFVPYISASTVATLLDQWVYGRWHDAYREGRIGQQDVIWCDLSIEVAPGRWITRTDVGVPTNFEPAKGGVSDAFKRASCLKWGVGRNVYDLVGVWAPVGVKRNGQPQPSPATRPAILQELGRMGYSADGLRLQQADIADDAPSLPATEQPKPAAASSPAAGRTRPRAKDDTVLGRINALGLKGAAFTALRDEIIEQGVPWPPTGLTDEQKSVVEEILANRGEAA